MWPFAKKETRDYGDYNDINFVRSRLNYCLAREKYLYGALNEAVLGEDASFQLEHYDKFFKEGYDKVAPFFGKD